MPMAPSQRLKGSAGSGFLRWKTTVAGSGASMWSRVVKDAGLHADDGAVEDASRW